MLIIVGLIGFLGWYVWHVKNTSRTSNTTQSSTTDCNNSQPLTKDIFSISCPIDNSTVSRKFTIIGEVDGVKNSGVNIYIDSDDLTDPESNWRYLDPTARSESGDASYYHIVNYIDGNGQMTIPIDLNGDKVIVQKTAVTGGYTYRYKGLEPGKHTFFFRIDEGPPPVPPGEINHPLLIEHKGPALTLNVR